MVYGHILVVTCHIDVLQANRKYIRTPFAPLTIPLSYLPWPFRHPDSLRRTPMQDAYVAM
jgi:hypothetical protein